MRIARGNKLMIESPSVATGDIAFNLLIFFLVCASSQPESGRRQEIPRSEQQQQKSLQSDNLEINLTRLDVEINGAKIGLDRFPQRIRELLAAKPKPEDKIVVVKSAKDAPYRHWIQVTGWIEQAGGTITLQVEEEQEVQVR